MISGFRRRGKSLVGLDIGSSAVKVVELRLNGGSYSVSAFGVEPLAPETIVDGAILDRGVVSDAVGKVLADHGIRAREVALSIAGNAVIVKRITLPAMSSEELRSSIYWEAKQYIPFDVEDVNLDYQVLEPLPDESTPGSQDVLLVAAKKDRIADYTEVVGTAGCVPVVMDVDAFAVQNAYELNHGVQPNAVVALLNIGASSVNVNVLQGDQPVFTRDLPTGGNAYTEALQKELGLGFDDAELLKKGVPVDGLTYDDADLVVRAVSENLIMEIGKTIDFFRATAPSGDIGHVIVTGGTSRVEGLTESLAERFDAQVEALDPFRQVTIEDVSVTKERRAELGPVSAVAVGLAMRRADDR